MLATPAYALWITSASPTRVVLTCAHRSRRPRPTGVWRRRPRRTGSSAVGSSTCLHVPLMQPRIRQIHPLHNRTRAQPQRPLTTLQARLAAHALRCTSNWPKRLSNGFRVAVRSIAPPHANFLLSQSVRCGRNARVQKSNGYATTHGRREQKTCNFPLVQCRVRTRRESHAASRTHTLPGEASHQPLRWWRLAHDAQTPGRHTPAHSRTEKWRKMSQNPVKPR